MFKTKSKNLPPRLIGNSLIAVPGCRVTDLVDSTKSLLGILSLEVTANRSGLDVATISVDGLTAVTIGSNLHADKFVIQEDEPVDKLGVFAHGGIEITKNEAHCALSALKHLTGYIRHIGGEPVNPNRFTDQTEKTIG